MKLHKLLCIVCYAICIATSCKKQIDESANISSSVIAQSTALHDTFFVSGIDNPYMPLTPGTVFHYVNTIKEHNEYSNEDIHVTVTSKIKKILGVDCEVVHDQVKEDGIVTEDTYDWYAQDNFGNVWYFGEDTKALTDSGGWSTEGSWEAGVHGAKQGIVMYAHPDKHIGETYYQEYQHNVAEDEATLLNTNSIATVPYGSFKNCVETREFTRLAPKDIENKFYAKGTGQVLTTSAHEREELLDVTHK